jgi:hypothetical protein
MNTKEIQNQHNKVNTSAGFDKHGRELFHAIDADEAHVDRGYLLEKLAAVEALRDRWGRDEDSYTIHFIALDEALKC